MSKTGIFFIMLFAACFVETSAQPGDLQVTLLKRPVTTSANKVYPGNKTPLLPLHLIKLPVGSIQPGGWVLKYLELQRDGLTG
jgi:hypothetical protein